MNTAAEFYEWLMQIEQDPSVPSACEVEFAEDDSQPSLTCSSTTDGSSCENSSLDTSLHSSSSAGHSQCANTTRAKQEQPSKRRVSFAKNGVHVREHAVTIGDHPYCFDGLPLTLDWEHAQDFVEYDIEVSRERLRKYSMPRRLSYEERREKLFSISDYNQDRVRNEEINMVINLLQQSWSQNYILPMPDLSPVIEDDNDDSNDIQHSDEVMEWRRNVPGA